eukprot:gene26533-18372_t
MKMMDAQQDYESSAAANVQQQDNKSSAAANVQQQEMQAAQAIADAQVTSATTELIQAARAIADSQVASARTELIQAAQAIADSQVASARTELIQAAQAIADSQVASAKTELVHALELAEKSVKETSRLKEELKKSMAEAEVSEDKARQFEALCEEALASRQQALSALDDAAFQESQLCRDMEDLKRSVAKHKDDAMTAKAHMVTSALGTGANTPSADTVTLEDQPNASGCPVTATREDQDTATREDQEPHGNKCRGHRGQHAHGGSILHPGVSISPRGINSRPMSPAPRGYTHAASTYSGPTFTNIPGSQGGGWGGKGGYDRGLPFPGASSTRRPMSVVDSVPGSRPKSPSQERLEELSRVEKGATADLREFP